MPGQLAVVELAQQVALIEAIEALLQPAAHSSKGTRPPAGRGRRSRQRALIAGQPGCLNLVRHLALVLPLLFDALVGHVPDEWGKAWVAGQTVHHDSHVLGRSEEHTSELHSLMRISYAVFCLK